MQEDTSEGLGYLVSDFSRTAVPCLVLKPPVPFGVVPQGGLHGGGMDAGSSCLLLQGLVATGPIFEVQLHSGHELECRHQTSGALMKIHDTW